MAETFTPNYNLSKFDQGDNPPILTAAKLNANLDTIDLELKNRDTYDRFAATRIVDPAGAGTHTTIAAALASMPAAGGTIFLKGVTFNESVGLSVPANVRIVGAGRDSTIINMLGSITLFTTAGGYFSLAGLTVQGNNAVVQHVFSTNHNVHVRDCDLKTVYGVVAAVSSAVSVSMVDCTITLASAAGIGIYLWRGATGGTLLWNRVRMSVPITGCNIIEGATPNSTGCDWTVVRSEAPEATPGLSNFFFVRTVDWTGLTLHDAQVTVGGSNNKVTACHFSDTSITMKAAKNNVANSTFIGGGTGGYDVFGAQLAIEVLAGGAAESVISGCKFDGNNVSIRGVRSLNSNGVVVSGCSFLNHFVTAVYLDSGISPARSVVYATGCHFASTRPVWEEDATCEGHYVGCFGLFSSIILGTRSIVDVENYRNVRTFGAIGDGVADDTGAIGNAISSLPTVSGVLFFPPGTYKITSTRMLPAFAVAVKGCGDSSVLDISSGSFAAFTVPSGLASRQKYSIEDLKILGGGDGVSTPVGGALVGATLNNTFASAPSITGGNGTFAAGSTVGFTKEGGEPNHAGNVGGKSGWLEWTAPASGTCTIDLSGSSFDTLLGVYTGVSVGALSLIASDDDSGAGSTSLVIFSAVMGTSYKIAVDGYGGASGTVTFTMTLIAGAGATNGSIVSVTDALSYGDVSLERVNSYAVRTPLKVTDGSGSPVIISAIDCYFQQVANNGQSILCNNGPSFPEVNLSLVRVDFYREYGDVAVGGTFAAGEYLSGFSNVSIVATDCHFLISIGCSLGALNLTGCEVANWTPGNNPVIYVEDDNYSTIASAVTGCRLTYIDLDLNGTGTRFEGCFFDSCYIKDNAISGLENCYFTGSVAEAAVIIGTGDTSIVGCHFASGTAGTSYTIDDPGYVSACFIGTGAPTANIRVPSGAAIIEGNSIGVGGGAVSILETGPFGNSRYSNNLYSVAPTFGSTSGSRLEGVRRHFASGVSAGAAYVFQFSTGNERGAWCVGTIKNTGANPLTVKEEVTDMFGVTDLFEQVVAGGADAPLSSLVNIATSRPPYAAYDVYVKHNGVATTFSLSVSQTGAP